MRHRSFAGPAAGLLLLLGISPTAAADTLEIVRTLPHGGWSEGLDMRDGVLWTPYGHTIREVDPQTGAELARFTPTTGYQESVTWFHDKLWSLSWDDDSIWAGTLDGAGVMHWTMMGRTPDIHGWGITHDDENLIMTGNGQPFLYFVNPDTMALVKTVTTPVDDLEDLAWDGRYVWASSYSDLQGMEVRLDPDTGDLVDLYPLPEPSECMKLDGVEVANGELYVTGKDCPFIYVATLPPL